MGISLTGRSSAKRQAALANQIAKQGVDIQQQGLAFEMAKHEELEPVRRQKIFTDTQGLAGMGGLLNQIFQNEVLNPQLQMQGQMGGFSGLGNDMFGQPSRKPQTFGGGSPGGRFGQFGSRDTGGRGPQPPRFEPVSGVPSAGAMPGRTTRPSSISKIEPPADSAAGTAPTFPADSGRFPLAHEVSQGYLEAQETGADSPAYQPKAVQPPGGPSGIPQAQGPSADIAKQLYAAFSPGGQFSSQLNMPDIVQPGREISAGIVDPRFINQAQMGQQVQGREISTPGQVQQQGVSTGPQVQGQIVDPGQLVQGQASQLGPRVERGIAGPGQQVQGQEVSLPDLVGVGGDYVKRAQTAAQDPFEALIRGRRRDIGSRNQYGGGQVQAGVKGAKFLQSQAGSRAASGAQERLEDRLYGQQLSDRDRRIEQRLGIEGLRRQQGLTDRDRDFQQRLGQQDLAVQQGLQERGVGLEESRGIEALRRGQLLGDRESALQQGIGVEALRRGEEGLQRDRQYQQGLSGEALRQQQGLSDRELKIQERLGSEALRRQQGLSDRQIMQQESIKDRESMREQLIRNAREGERQGLVNQQFMQGQQLSDRDRMIADQIQQRNLAQGQAAAGLEFSLKQAAQERDMLNRLAVSERDRPFSQFAQMMGILGGMPTQHANVAGVAAQTGGNIGNIGANLGSQAQAALQSAYGRGQQLFGAALGAGGAAGMFGGNIQGMYGGGAGGGGGYGFGSPGNTWMSMAGY